VFAGTRGQFYPHQSAIIRDEILKNADPSYDKSPAKEIALQSTKEWKHFVRIHKLKIMSTDYANIRQYCEVSKKQAVLVEISENGQKQLLETAAEDLVRA